MVRTQQVDAADLAQIELDGVIGNGENRRDGVCPCIQGAERFFILQIVFSIFRFSVHIIHEGLSYPISGGWKEHLSS